MTRSSRPHSPVAPWTPRLVAAAHLAGAVPPWSVYGHELLTYWPGQLADPAHIPTLAATLARVADLIGR